MTNIQENINNVTQKIVHAAAQVQRNAHQIQLLAVSKTKPVSLIKAAYLAGQRDFGENYVQEGESKVKALKQLCPDIEWHFIGHLQRNKVKYMADFVDLIHGVDSFKTLIEINKQAKKHNRVISCLLQAHIAEESTKFGFNFTEIEEILISEEIKGLKNIKIVGLMGMATFTDDENQLKKEFTSLKNLFTKNKKNNNDLTTLSMGMSGDYKLAIKCGSTMVRVGSAIFGNRNYIT